MDGSFSLNEAVLSIEFLKKLLFLLNKTNYTQETVS